MLGTGEQKMELNREQIEKSSDWLDSLVGNSNDSDIAMYTYQLLGILYDTCEELSEENERLRADNLYGLSASKLAKKVEELSRENEWLSNRVVCKVVIPEEKLEEIKSECLERVELDIKAIEADTMRKMLTMIKERLVQLLMDSSYLDVLDEEHWIPAADQLFDEIDQITKEMLEGAE